MSPVILLAAMVLLPAVVLTLLRVNAAVVFLSLCLGSVLVQFMGSDSISLTTTIFPHVSSLSENTLQIGLLVLPAVLTTVFMFHSVRGTKLVLNLLPALSVGLLLILLIQPLLSLGLQGTIAHTSLWHQYTRAQSLVVGAAALINLAFLWFERRGHASHERSSRRHKN